MQSLAILHADSPTGAELNLSALVNFLGVETHFIPVSRASLASGEFLAQISGASAAAVSASTLCAIESQKLLDDLVAQLDQSPLAGFFVYGYESAPVSAAVARKVIGLALKGVEPVQDGSTVSFPQAGRAFTRQLAGLSLNRSPAAADCGFGLEANGGAEAIMEIGGKPAFIRALKSGKPWFHWTAVDEIANPAAKISGDEFVSRCDRALAPIIFLRAMFPGLCWRNPLTTARIIIDDPLLEMKYGFLRYDDLVESIERLGYGVTTAFIPWNFRRTRAAEADFFARHEPGHTICVHGCDHTNNEFGAMDEDLLTQKATLGLERMAAHRQRTGVTCEPVMVYPQGRFSSMAMKALRRAGYLAVVNSTRKPRNIAESALCLGDELLPATNSFSGVPIFMRRYPKEQSAYALDLFLGKPAHIVEHHEWFARGCGEAEKFARFLKEVEPDIKWPSLWESLRRQHLRRTARDGACDVQFFTGEFIFEHTEPRPRLFRFSKADPEAALVEKITVNGSDVAFTRADGRLSFSCELNAGQKAEIRVCDKIQPVPKTWSPGAKYQMAVRLRRALSELRDYHLARHQRLFKAAKRIVRALKMSADAS